MTIYEPVKAQTTIPLSFRDLQLLFPAQVMTRSPKCYHSTADAALKLFVVFIHPCRNEVNLQRGISRDFIQIAGISSLHF